MNEIINPKPTYKKTSDSNIIILLPSISRACGVLIYMILVSYPPFLHHTPIGIRSKIIGGIYEFHPEHWERISDDAKDFVSRLLTVDMTARMTAEQALQHPWVSEITQPFYTLLLTPSCMLSF